MLRNLALTRPLAVIDLETTGTNADRDRIVEISVLRLTLDGERTHRTRRLNPGVPIPAAATNIHGIRDSDVASEPHFEQVAQGLLEFLDGCDLCGYNLKKFDLRVLYCEFRRAGRSLSLEGGAIVDPMQVFHHFEPRDLTAAVRKFLNREHEGAHSAATDVLATVEVLDAMVAHYEDLPGTIAELHIQFAGTDCIDGSGFFRRVEGELRFVKGTHRGQSLAAVAEAYPDYLLWLMRQDLFDDTKAIVREALAATSDACKQADPASADVIVHGPGG